MAVLVHFCGPALTPPEPREHRSQQGQGPSMHKGSKRPWAMASLLDIPVLLTASLLTLLID